MKVSLLTNGPGELWGWVRPMVMELRRRGHSVSLWLLPCPFASGHEREAASLLGVDKLEGPASPANLWRALKQEKTDCVLQLGGDLLFGSRLAKGAGAPLLCYSYGPKKGMKDAEVFTAYPSMAFDMPEARVIGDLLLDALALDAQGPEAARWDWPEEEGSPRLLLLPGNRAPIRKTALVWLREIVFKLRREFPRLRVRTLFSPFMPAQEFALWREAELDPVRAGAGAAMRSADFALTQPGTNTLELMHCGLPSLVVAPSAFLEHIPVAGARGVIAGLPLVGGYFRKKAVKRILDRHRGSISLPGRIAGHPVMDELYGDIGPDDIVLRIAQALKDREGLLQSRKELLSLSGKPGAAARLCGALPAGA